MKATPRMHTYGKLPAKITINSEQHGAQWGFSDKKNTKNLCWPNTCLKAQNRGVCIDFMTSALQFRGYFSVFLNFLCRFALKEMENALTLHSQIGHNATPNGKAMRTRDVMVPSSIG